MSRQLLVWLMVVPLVGTAAIAPSPPAFPENQNSGSPVLFKPSGGGKPPTTRGAGSRSDRLCPQDAPPNPSDASIPPLPLTALVPAAQIGLTWANHPTFWIYLPKTTARQMVLSIKGTDSQLHSQRLLPTPGAAGIVGIPLDATTPPLELGKSYQWAVVLLCGDRPSPNDPVVTGWVQRVNPTQPHTSQDTLQRANLYGQQGVWYDALTTLATARRSQPNNAALAQIWVDFLSQPTVNLAAIANQPMQ